MYARLAERIACALAVMLLWSVPVAAQDAKTVKLVTGNNYHPYADESLPGGGLAAEIVRAVFDSMGFEVALDFLPWDEGYRKAREGYYLGTFPYIVEPERKQDFAYTAELFTVRPYVFWNVERKMRILDFSDLSGKTLCLPKGWALDQYLKPLSDAGDITMIGAESMRGCFERLRDGSADVVSADRRLGQGLAEEISDTRWVKTRRFAEKGFPNHMMFTLAHPQARQWAQAFDAALATLRDEGRIYEIVRNYYKN